MYKRLSKMGGISGFLLVGVLVFGSMTASAEDEAPTADAWAPVQTQFNRYMELLEKAFWAAPDPEDKNKILAQMSPMSDLSEKINRASEKIKEPSPWDLTPPLNDLELSAGSKDVQDVFSRQSPEIRREMAAFRQDLSILIGSQVMAMENKLLMAKLHQDMSRFLEEILGPVPYPCPAK